MDKYTILRTDTADSLIHKIILDIAEKFGADVALGKLDEANTGTEVNTGAHQQDQHPGAPGNSVQIVYDFSQSHGIFSPFLKSTSSY